MLKGVPDLLKLPDYTEGSLLHGLRARFGKAVEMPKFGAELSLDADLPPSPIYSWVGEILVSVNPFCETGAFNKAHMQKFIGKEGYIFTIFGSFLDLVCVTPLHCHNRLSLSLLPGRRSLTYSRSRRGQ